MGLLNRLQLGLQTDLGIVFFGLLGALILMIALYAILAFIRKKQDAFSSSHRDYYDAIDALPKDISYASPHKAEFWGRQTIVSLSDGKQGLCLVPPPNLANELARARFQSFLHAVGGLQHESLAPYIRARTDNVWMAVQEGLLKPDGRLLHHLNYYLADKKLTEKKQESILLALAGVLDKLHGLETETAERLYHGFLLPRSIFLEVDSEENVKKVLLADAGLAYSVGSDLLLQRLNQLRSGKLPIEKFPSMELQEQLPMLAPEQRVPTRLKDVGPASDFYAFGALAVSVFTQKRFSEKDKIDWSRIPRKWQPFIEKCLQDSIADRPKSFRELHELLKEEEELSAQDGDAQGHLLQATKYLEIPDWNKARKHLVRALSLDSQNAEANVKLAITYFELGDMISAERHYTLAKEADPKKARAYRDHIAFKV